MSSGAESLAAARPRGGGAALIAATFVVLAVYRVVTSAFAILVIPLEAEFAATRAEVTAIFAAHMLVYAVTSPLSGIVVGRIGAPATVMIGGCLAAAGLVASAFSTDILSLACAYGLVAGAGAAMMGLPANFVILSGRFPDRVASAMGVAAVGMGVGVLAGLPLLQWLAGAAGWRTSLLAGGLTALPIVAACALAQSAFGGQAAAGPASRPVGSNGIAAIVASPQWRLYAGSNFFMGAALFGILTHQVAIIVGIGLSAVSAAVTLGLVNLLRSASGPLWGVLVDRRGAVPAFGAGAALAVAGLLFLAAPQAVAGPLTAGAAFTLLFGVGSGGSLPTYAAIAAAIFGPSERAIAWGLTDMCYAAGAALGAWSVGALYDATGGYGAALAMITGQIAISFLLARALDARRRAAFQPEQLDDEGEGR